MIFPRAGNECDAESGCTRLSMANHGCVLRRSTNSGGAFFPMDDPCGRRSTPMSSGRAADHADVACRRPLKDAADVLDDVDVFDDAIAARAKLFRGLGRRGHARRRRMQRAVRRPVFRHAESRSGRGISIKSCLLLAAALFPRMPRARF